MSQPDFTPKRRTRVRRSLAVAVASGAGAVTLVFPTVAHAEPVPPTPPPGTEAPAAPAPADPNAPAPAPEPAPAPAPADPNAPAEPAPAPAPADPDAAPPAEGEPTPVPEPGRVNNPAGGFSYVVPQGWVVGDASRLNYGQALLTKQTGPAEPGQPAPTSTDTSILLGRLDLKLFAGAEPDNAKAAVRLASDMGEFFMPYAGTRINQQTGPLNAGGMPGSFSSYDVKFTDSAKPNGQIWAGVVGTAVQNAPRGQRNERWFVVWLGTDKDPIDKAAAEALANSIRPWAPPPPPPPAPVDPNAPAPEPDPNAPAPVPGRNPVGVPVPVQTPVPEMMPPA